MGNDSRQYLSRDARRTQLLELGLRLFSARSYYDVSIDDIAREAGVSKGLLYHYFGGKRALYTDVIGLAAERLLLALAPAPDRPPRENLDRGLRAYLAFVAAHADAYLALMHGGLGADARVQTILEETRGAVVTATLARLALDPAEAPAQWRLAARGWLGAVEASALDWLAHRDVPVDEIVVMLTAQLGAALAVAQAQAPMPGVPSFLGMLGELATAAR